MSTSSETVIERQAKATSSAIATFAGIADARTVHTLVLAGMREVAKELSGAATPGGASASVTPATSSTAVRAPSAPASAGASAPARRTTITPPSTMVVPFGNTAGRQLGTLITSDVRWVEAALRRALIDPVKVPYLERNRGMLIQVEAELARRAEESATAPAGGG